MSEAREAFNETRQQQQIQKFLDLGYDQRTAERMAINFPLAFQGADTLRSGAVVNPQQLQELWKNFKMSDMEGDAQNMSFQQYLNDPRAAVRLENGQYIWRPEKMQGDFYGKNKESWLDTLKPILSVALPALGGFAASELGLFGGSGTLDQFSPAWETFAGDPTAGWNLADMGGLGDAASGSFDMAVNGGSVASPFNAGGFDFSNTYNQVPEIPSGPVNPVNTNLTAGNVAGSYNGIEDLIRSAASGGTGTVGSVGAGTVAPGGIGEIAGALGTGGAAAGSAPTSWWDTIMNSVGDSNLQKALKGGASLLELLQGKDNASNLQAGIDAATTRGDPFGTQRPFYQNMLLQSYTDPNFWKNNAVFKGLNDVAVNDASRVAAARGFNNSSNLLYDIADRVQKTGMNYANQFQGQLATNAGAGISPGNAAAIAAQGANQVYNANQQSNGATGAIIRDLPNIVNGIKGVLP